jgi:hypothetical protein
LEFMLDFRQYGGQTCALRVDVLRALHRRRQLVERAGDERRVAVRPSAISSAASSAVVILGFERVPAGIEACAGAPAGMPALALTPRSPSRFESRRDVSRQTSIGSPFSVLAA